MATAKQKAEGTPESEILSRARAVEALQANPVWKEILDGIEDDLINQIKLTEVGQVEQLQNLHSMLKASQKLRTALATAAQSGVLKRNSASRIANGMSNP